MIKIKKNNIVLCLLVIIMSLCNILVCLASNNLNFILFSSIVAGILLVVVTTIISNDIFNVINVFSIFLVLYSLSGPIEIFNKGYIHPIFNNDYKIPIFLIAYHLSIIGYILGIIIGFNPKSTKSFIAMNQLKIKNNFKISIFLAALAGIMTIVDFFRVGGISTLLQGKAIYFEAISNLSPTLPNVEIAKIASVIFISNLVISKKKNIILNYKSLFLKFIIFISPYIYILTISGSRGSILIFIFIIITGYRYFDRSIYINKKYIVLLVISYFAMAFIYINRPVLPYVVSTGDWSVISENMKNKELVIEGLMPGSNEFTAAFGNFNEYFLSDNKELLLGKSYIKDINIMIPTFLYPEGKPKSITYEFRDKFFYSQSLVSDVASTGFSALLEAYMNFGMIGILFLYILFGYFIGNIEKKRVESKSYLFMLWYMSIFQSITMVFHRSQLANILIDMLFSFIYILLYKIIINLIRYDS